MNLSQIHDTKKVGNSLIPLYNITYFVYADMSSNIQSLTPDKKPGAG